MNHTGHFGPRSCLQLDEDAACKEIVTALEHALLGLIGECPPQPQEVIILVTSVVLRRLEFNLGHRM